MSELLRFFKDMRDNGYGLAEIAAQLGTSAIAEPVAGFAAMYDPVHGADAIREGMTYQPRTQEAQQYSQSIGNAAKTAIKPAMPIIDTWKKGVDIAGQYSPVVGAALRTVPTAIGIAMGAKPALQAGRQASESLGAMQGRMIANANMPNTINNGFRGQRGVFAGINALTADKEALAKAKAMIARGEFPDDVWQETGWGQGADGKWRFEINDKFDVLDDGSLTGSYMNADNAILGRLANNEIGVARARQVLNHDDLYAAYPDLAMTSVRPSKATTGAFNPDSNTITLNAELLRRAQNGQEYGIIDNAHSVTLHEIQHAIQQKEGFAKGGSPDQFKGLYNDPKEAYNRLAGEVESRSVQNRMHLTPEQRRDINPFTVGRYGYGDIPKDKQIVSYNNNPAMSQRPLTEFEQAHLTAQRNAALPVEKGGLGLPADNAPRTLNAGYMGQRGAIGLTNDFDNSDEIKIIADYLGQSPESMLVNRDLYTKKQGAINSLVSRYEQMDDFSGAYYPTSYGYISISPSAKSNGQWQLTSFDKKMNPLSDQGEMPKNKALTEFFKTIKPNKYGNKSQGNQ